MTEELVVAPKAGVLVQSHLPGILRHLETEEPAEFERLLTKEHSKEQFRLSYPFFKKAADIAEDGDSTRFWANEYVVGDSTVRVCSQWTDKHRPFFLAYLVERGIPTVDVSPELREEWLEVVDQSSTVSKSLGGARYRGTPIGVGQNSLVRYLLSNVGQENFSQAGWEAVKASFGGACAYCGIVATLEMDHAIPISRVQLGEHRLGNLVPACASCNAEKGQTRFRPYLADKYRHDPVQLAQRIGLIEDHMARHGYRPLGEREDVREVLERARQELGDLAASYVKLINEVIDG